MPDVSILDVLFYDQHIGTITNLPGDKSIFTFSEKYQNDPDRPQLSLSFKDAYGGLLTDFKPTQTRILPFFSNLLPEGVMRGYLADRAGVNPNREFFLLWVLGQDLPGAVKVRPADGEAWPPDANGDEDDQSRQKHQNQALRFSLAGVQLKFSAIKDAGKGLTIPAHGTGGSWIVKLPSNQFEGVPENEYSMMTLAKAIGIDVPEIKLVELDEIEGLPPGIGDLKGDAYAIRRFDRTEQGDAVVHIEDFAQVFSVYPEDKYKRASYRNIATVIWTETGEEGIAEYIRRLVFNTLIGNADMHLKNWSLIYEDKRTPKLAPAYDFVSTIPYIEDETAALKYARTRRMDQFSKDELAYLAGKAQIPERLVMKTAKETVKRFFDVWDTERENLPLSKRVIDAIEKQIQIVPIAKELAFS